MNKEDILKKLDIAKAELADIEKTNDKSRRLRWRELKKIIKYYEHRLKQLQYD
jgi:hypothetical protein